MRWMFSLGAIAGLVVVAVGCPGAGGAGGGGGKGSGAVSVDSPADHKIDLPNVPSKLEITSSQPTEANDPSARSPLLDIMKAESEREMASLSKQKDPAYYLAYQLVE